MAVMLSWPQCVRKTGRTTTTPMCDVVDKIYQRLYITAANKINDMELPGHSCLKPFTYDTLALG